MYSVDSATISLLDIIKKKPVQLVENIFIPLEKKIKIWKMLISYQIINGTEKFWLVNQRYCQILRSTFEFEHYDGVHAG